MTTTSYGRGSSRQARGVTVVTVILALLAVSLLLIHRSESAFSGTTGNSANLLATGTMALSDNDSGTFLWSETALVGGSSQQRCIEVTYTGTVVPSTPVRLYGTYVDSADANTTADSDLAPYLDTTVEVGPACAGFAASSTPFTGTLTAFMTANSSYASSLSTGWTPSVSGEKRAFRITMTVQNNDAAQGKTAEPAFTWEVRSS